MMARAKDAHPPLWDARGADLLQDLLKLVVAYLCKELPLRQEHIPAVVFYEVQRLIYRLQHMC